jgi:hypothetical protein
MSGSKDRGYRFALAAAGLLGLLFGLHRITDPDLFQQVAVGRAILADPGSIGVSHFHQGFPGYPYVADKWLASVLAALADGAGGGDGLMAWQILLCVSLGLAWMRLYRLAGANAPAALAGTALTFMACAFRTDPRPDTISMILLAWVAGMFVGGLPLRRVLWWFPLTMVLWVNLHGYFVTGLLVAAAAAAAALAGDRRWGSAGIRARTGLALLLGAAACCVHPQGWRAAVWPVQQLVLLLGEESPLRQAILEFQPTTILFAGAGAWWWLLLAATGAAAVLLAFSGDRFSPAVRTAVSLIAAAPWILHPPEGLRQWPYRVTMALLVMAAVELPAVLRERRVLEPLMLAGFALMALPVLRNLSLVPPAALLLLGPHWSRAAVGRPGRRILAAAAAVLVLTAGWARISDRLAPGNYRSPGWTGWGPDGRTLPVGAVDFVLEHDLPDPILNHFDNGGYLLYRMHPERRAFIAGNTSMYPPDFLESYRRNLIGGALSLEEYSRPHRFRTALVSHAALETGGLVRRLAGDPAWSLVFLDSAAAVWVRDAVDGRLDLDARYVELLRQLPDKPTAPRWLAPRERIYPSMNLAVFFRNTGRSDLALCEVRRLWEQGATPEMAALGAACSEDTAGLPGFVPLLEEVRRSHPDSDLVRTWLSRALYTRAVEALEAGRTGPAASDALRASGLTPDEPGPLILLARIAAVRGDREEARRLLARVLDLPEGAGAEPSMRADPLLGPLLP